MKTTSIIQKNLTVTFTVLIFISALMLKASAQTPPQPPTPGDPHRGLMVDKFLKFTNQSLNIGPPGQVDGAEFEIDTANSILGVYDAAHGTYYKEDELLNYCAQNHFTHICLYDLKNVFYPSRDDANYIARAWDPGTQTMQPMTWHLCRFMQKAYSLVLPYRITEISASGNSSEFLNGAVNAGQMMTPHLTFSSDEKNSTEFNSSLLFVENEQMQQRLQNIICVCWDLAEIALPAMFILLP
jgi:hypothetical protein